MPKISKNKQVYFNGFRFTQDAKTGYYLSSGYIYNGKQIRLHRYVWIYYNGEIPEGYDVHHKNEDKDNNDISNLELKLSNKHYSDHSIKNKRTEEWKNTWEEIRQKGSEAHKRLEMREKSSQLFKKQYAERIANSEPQKCICIECQKEYTTYNLGINMFCSRICKARNQRKRFKEEHGISYDQYIRPHRKRNKNGRNKID